MIRPHKGWQPMGFAEIWRFRELFGSVVWGAHQQSVCRHAQAFDLLRKRERNICDALVRGRR